MKKDKMIIVNAKSFMENASFSTPFIILSGLPQRTDPINGIIMGKSIGRHLIIFRSL